jgi:hypothetical protein
MQKPLHPSIRHLIDHTGTTTHLVVPIALFEKMTDIIEDQYFGQLAEEILATETEYIDWEEAKKRLLKKKSK